MLRYLTRNASLVGVLVLIACSNTPLKGTQSPLADTPEVEYYSNDAAMVEGRAQFKAGNYGRAFAAFEKAVTLQDNDPAALLGYAAAADMLRRFDKADTAYKKLGREIGNTPTFHNNYGYSLLLRGNLIGARKHFLAAYEIDPANEVTANNLTLLRNSINYPSAHAKGL